MTTRKLHYVSGIVLTVFTGLHLFNHICSVWGVQKHIAVMASLRPFYRNIFVETVILAAVLVQIISGAQLFRRGRKQAVSVFEKLHSRTGLYLAIFFVIHVGAVLAGRLFLHLDTNFYFGTAGLNTFPFSLFFIPYYSLAVISFFGHLAAIHNKRMRRAVFGCTPGQQSAALFALGFLVTAIMMYGLTNHFKGVQIPAEYNVLIGR